MLRQGRALLRGALGAFAVLLFGAVGPAEAATYTVTTTEDPGPSTCGPTLCTLRAAMNLANTAGGGHTIAFNIAPGGVQTITPLTPLPNVQETTLIDGTTQPGFRGKPVIEIDGSIASRTASPNNPPSGLNILANNVVIQGLVINRWSRSGIWIQGQANKVQGNYVGTDPSGTQARGNGTGITILTGNANQIGWTVPAQRNVISGNTGWGISIFYFSNVVKGNYIGTDATGTQALGNGQGGIAMIGADHVTIGGYAANERNVISGNGGDGVDVSGGERVKVLANYIGVNANGAPLGNDGHGVHLGGNIRDSQVGGNTSDQRNTIGYNTGAGIRLSNESSSATGNRFSENELRQNGRLGIDIGLEGVTPNDPGDGDSGANRLQNFPILLSAGSGNNWMTVTGTLDSQPGTYEIEFFLNAAGGCDPSGYGEAHSYLGNTQVTVGRQPAWFQATLPPPAINQFVTATATRIQPGDSTVGDTSELSLCQRIDLPWITVTAPQTTTTEAGGQATFTIELSTLPVANVTIGISSSDTTEGTVSPSTLTFTPQNATQPQTVTVTGIDDTIVDGNVQYTIITAPAQSGDSHYGGRNPIDLTMTNIDNDSP